MNREFVVRRVKPGDFERVALHGCFREDDVARRPAYAVWVKRRIEAGTYLGRFAIENDVVVSGAGAVLLDWGPTRANPSGTMARIVNVYTEPAWRREGLARRLLEALLADCEHRGFRAFNLGTTDEARGLYGTLGFRQYAAEMRLHLVDKREP